MRREYPKHPIFNHPPFASAEYTNFERDLLAAVDMAVDEDPHILAIQKAIPAVSDRLRTMTGIMQISQVTTSQVLREISWRVDDLKSVITDFVTGSFNISFTPGSQQPLPSVFSPHPQPISSSGLVPLVPSPIERLVQTVLAYKLSRTIYTIPDLWREWTKGLAGQPSVEALDACWGSRWWTGAEPQFYSRRKVIIDEIKRLAGENEDYETIVDELEQQRLRSGASLSKVINALKVEAKTRE